MRESRGNVSGVCKKPLRRPTSLEQSRVAAICYNRRTALPPHYFRLLNPLKPKPHQNDFRENLIVPTKSKKPTGFSQAVLP